MGQKYAILACLRLSLVRKPTNSEDFIDDSDEIEFLPEYDDDIDLYED
jgi:hypothetical protein